MAKRREKMEKIKKIVNVLPWIILIIAVTAIFAMIRYMGLEEESIIENNKETVAELQAEIADLQAEKDELHLKIDDLQSKAEFYQEQIDAYSDKPDEWQGVIDGLYDQLKKIYTADPEALDALAEDLFMKAGEKIAKNDYSTFPEYTKRGWNAGVTEPLETEIDGAKCEMRYYPFYWLEEEYSNLFTGDLLDKVFDKRFIIKEGYLYVKEVEKGATEWGVANAELTKISETGDEIKYSVKYDREENGKITDKGLTCTMTIIYEEGRYKVSDTDFGNL